MVKEINPSGLTVGRLREVLRYDPETGVFTWRNRTGAFARLNGQAAGNLNKHTGYVQISVDGYNHAAHRLVHLYMTGRWPIGVDHMNRDRGDNRWCNLREADQSRNSANQTMSKNNTSGYKGVTWHKKTKKWHAQITVDRRHIGLGLYADPAEAHKAYMRAAARYFGEFARAS